MIFAASMGATDKEGVPIAVAVQQPPVAEVMGEPYHEEAAEVSKYYQVRAAGTVAKMSWGMDGSAQGLVPWTGGCSFCGRLPLTCYVCAGLTMDTPDPIALPLPHPSHRWRRPRA